MALKSGDKPTEPYDVPGQPLETSCSCCGGDNTGPNPPTASDASYETPLNVPVDIDKIALSDDPDGDLVGVVLKSDPINGTVTDNSDGTCTYTPNNNYFGTDSFTYCSVDAEGMESDPATIDITITAEPPEAVDDGLFTIPTNAPYVIDKLANDIDGDFPADVSTVVVKTQPSNGSVVANADGTCTYTPNQDYEGPDSFTYCFQDLQGQQSNEATVDLEIEKPPSGNFVRDDSEGGDGSNVSASDVKDAINNGDPMGVTIDGTTTILDPATTSGLQALVEAVDSGIVFDAATCEWEDPNGALPVVPVCLNVEETCGIDTTLVGYDGTNPGLASTLPDSVTDLGGGVYEFVYSRNGTTYTVHVTITGGSLPSVNGNNRLLWPNIQAHTSEIELVSVVNDDGSDCLPESQFMVYYSDFDNPNFVDMDDNDNGGTTIFQNSGPNVATVTEPSNTVEFVGGGPATENSTSLHAWTYDLSTPITNEVQQTSVGDSAALRVVIRQYQRVVTVQSLCGQVVSATYLDGSDVDDISTVQVN